MKAREPERERRAISGAAGEAVISGRRSPLAVGGAFTEHLLLCISRLPAIARNKLKGSRKAFPPVFSRSITHQTINTSATGRGVRVCGAVHEYTVCNHCQTEHAEIHFCTH